MPPPDKSAQTSHVSMPDLSANCELGHRWQRVEAAWGAKEPGSHGAQPS